MKLNFACGPTRWPGFDNSDIHGEPGTSYVDLEDRPLPYPDGSAEIVMHSHGLLMTHPDLSGLFSEWHRILMPGGWLRLDDNPYRFYDHGTENIVEGAGFPADQRISRRALKAMLITAGFGPCYDIDPGRTKIPADPATVEAILGNHNGHESFAVEAQKW